MKLILTILLFLTYSQANQKKVIKDSIAIYSANVYFDKSDINSLMMDDLACLMKKGDLVKVKECRFSKKLKYTNCYAMSLSRDCNGWVKQNSLK